MNLRINQTKTEDVEIPPGEGLSSKISGGDPLYPVIIESQDNSDKTEDEEIPVDEGLSSNSLKDEKEIFIIEGQETDQLKRETSRDTLDLERLNNFIADRDTQTETEPNSEVHGNWNGLLWCCSRSVRQNRVQQKRFIDLSYHGYNTLDEQEGARKHPVVMPVDYRRDTTDILLQEKNNHTVEPSLTDRTTKIISKPKGRIKIQFKSRMPEIRLKT
ncbi:unnamed protein product [Mytilus edulis]|uniref:Uncharacterized protein n=1 Tax=Mytilus edulis TaxID=6550 RepID=A0A8S3V0W7_MYTED|nr:unnamed protein product [Mytilus edulis]